LYVFSVAYDMRNRKPVDKKAIRDPADADLFRQALDDVIPLRKAPHTVPPSPQRRAKTAEGRQTGVREHPDSSAPGGTDTAASFCRAGIQKRFLQRLKRGHYPPEDQLDLHRMDTATARGAVSDFIGEALGRGLRCVRIIHGKGLHSQRGPQLQSVTRHLLRQRAEVLAYTACKPGHGGDGATDVLLQAR